MSRKKSPPRPEGEKIFFLAIQPTLLGVRFSIGSQTHYGWIRLTVTTDPDPRGPAMSAKITGYAYETVPNKTILAGTAGTPPTAEEKPKAEVQVSRSTQGPTGPSLGMLSAGADALPMWRREERFG